MGVHCCADHAHKESLFDRFLSPWLIHGACSLPPISAQRQKIVPLAEGVVVEFGMGTGLNMPYYDAGKVTKLIGIDPAAALMKHAEAVAKTMPFDVDLYIDGAENIPLEDNSADCVVVTYAFCTIPDNVAAVREARRVLKPSGRLLFSEHGVSDRSGTAKWQNLIDPLWTRMAGGCHLNRNVEELLLDEGFAITELEKKRMTGVPGVLGFNYRGIATPR
jgi:SAM-dependent methyltransferase